MNVGNAYTTLEQDQAHNVSAGLRSTNSSNRQFLSRPNWLFTHNENVLFCTALQSLKKPDQNNVPRKFIEEWLGEKMVSLDTKWPAGSKFLTESISEMKNNPKKSEERQNREIEARQKGFYKSRQQALASAKRNLDSAMTPEDKQAAEIELKDAESNAKVEAKNIDVPTPTIEEVALVELQTKIVRRLQGQTDRLDMAQSLSNIPFQGEASDYFQELQNEVLQAIEEKYKEIKEDRDKVETKSKQSRKRRRDQVSNGVTMSGSATRVRFTNREMAMLIHWIYTYPKSDWTQKIYEHYISPPNSPYRDARNKPLAARSAEHVRDKMRDLISRSREPNGLSSLKPRAAGGYSAKTSDPATNELLLSDLQDFTYPQGPLDHIPGGRFFNEDIGKWENGPLPREILDRYRQEIERILKVVVSKRLNKPEDHSNVLVHSVQNENPPHVQNLYPYAHQAVQAIPNLQNYDPGIMGGQGITDGTDLSNWFEKRDNAEATHLAAAALEKSEQDLNTFLHDEPDLKRQRQ